MRFARWRAGDAIRATPCHRRPQNPEEPLRSKDRDYERRRIGSPRFAIEKGHFAIRLTSSAIAARRHDLVTTDLIIIAMNLLEGDFSKYPKVIQATFGRVAGETIALRETWLVYHRLFMEDEGLTDLL